MYECTYIYKYVNEAAIGYLCLWARYLAGEARTLRYYYCSIISLYYLRSTLSLIGQKFISRQHFAS